MKELLLEFLKQNTAKNEDESLQFDKYKVARYLNTDWHDIDRAVQELLKAKEIVILQEHIGVIKYIWPKKTATKKKRKAKGKISKIEVVK